MKLSNAVTATLLAAGNAYAAPYDGLAKKLATAIAGTKAHGDAVKAERSTLWDTFKSACTIGLKAEHDANALRAGLEIACVNAGIPAGSFRGYVSTIGSLYGDLIAGNLSEGELADISVKDARERYMDADKRLLNEARKRLNDAVKGWSVAAIIAFAEMAEKVNEKAAASEAGEEPSEETLEAANG